VTFRNVHGIWAITVSEPEAPVAISISASNVVASVGAAGVLSSISWTAMSKSQPAGSRSSQAPEPQAEAADAGLTPPVVAGCVMMTFGCATGVPGLSANMIAPHSTAGETVMTLLPLAPAAALTNE
jgi:hypothetical protein